MGGLDWRNIHLCCGTGVGPLPKLRFDGEGYGVKGVKFASSGSTSSGKYKLRINGAQSWDPSEGPMDKISEGLPNVSLNN